ncbi:hypothetical protein D3C78_20700 [compost metagenome]
MLKLAWGDEMVPIDLGHSKFIQNGSLPESIIKEFKSNYPGWEYDVGSNWIVYFNKAYDRFTVEENGYMLAPGLHKTERVAMSKFTYVMSLTHSMANDIDEPFVDEKGIIFIPQNYCDGPFLTWTEILKADDLEYIITICTVSRYTYKVAHKQYTYKLNNAQVIKEVIDIDLPVWLDVMHIPKKKEKILPGDLISVDEIKYQSDKLFITEFVSYGKTENGWKHLNRWNVETFDVGVQNEYALWENFNLE